MAAYTGLAAFVDKTQRPSFTSGKAVFPTVYIDDWLTKRLKGESRSIGEIVSEIRREASALLRPIPDDPEQLAFSFATFSRGRPKLFEISNLLQPDGRRAGRVGKTLHVNEVVFEGSLVAYAGEYRAVAAEDREVLVHVSRHRHKRFQDINVLLAEVNERASHYPCFGNVISPGCYVTYMPPSGELYGDIFDRDEPDVLRIPNMLLFGIDLGSTMREQMENFAKTAEGRSTRLGRQMAQIRLRLDEIESKRIEVRHRLDMHTCDERNEEEWQTLIAELGALTQRRQDLRALVHRLRHQARKEPVPPSERPTILGGRRHF
jgi:hypothetical protein